MPAKFESFKTETMNLDNFITLNNSLAKLKEGIPMDQLLLKYKIELFD